MTEVETAVGLLARRTKRRVVVVIRELAPPEKKRENVEGQDDERKKSTTDIRLEKRGGAENRCFSIGIYERGQVRKCRSSTPGVEFGGDKRVRIVLASTARDGE